MSVKKDEFVRRSVQAEVEVPGTFEFLSLRFMRKRG